MKTKKVAVEKIDGLGPQDIVRIQKALRKVWSWNYARKLVILRCTDEHGFGVCEKCHNRCPKVFVDHIKPIGTFNPREYIERLFISSTLMQGLCSPCHKIKTKTDMVDIKSKLLDFY